MAETSEYPDAPATDPVPVQQVETLDDRLRRLEAAMSAMQTHAANAAVAASENGLVPTALFGAVVPGLAPPPPDGAWGRIPVLQEFRLMVRMYLDDRYRLSRVAQFGVPLVVALMVLNYLFFSTWNLWIVPPILERLLLIVLAIALYKILSREVARYSAVLAYLARYSVGR
jgi:hypothetical protein